jgi:hypothetical protein
MYTESLERTREHGLDKSPELEEITEEYLLKLYNAILYMEKNNISVDTFLEKLKNENT